MPAERHNQTETASDAGACWSWRRLAPLGVALALAAVVFAMGWHRELSLENLVRHRATLDAFVEAHQWTAVALFVAAYVAVVALSLPCAAIMTLASGVLFGTLAGGGASVIGATLGAAAIFLIAKTAFGAQLAQRAGSVAERLAEGFRKDAFNYLLFLRLVPVFPFFVVNLAAAVLGVRLATFIAATSIGIIPAIVCVRHGRRRARQRDRRPGGPLPCLPRSAAGRLPPRFRHWRGVDPRTHRCVRGARRGRAHSRRHEAASRTAHRRPFGLNMAERLTPDLCIIGAGSGGLSVAAAAAALGVPVVLIEKAKMGGDCLNTGCVPSKALLAAAKRAEAFRSSAAFGVKPQRPSIEFYQVNDHVHGVIAAIAPNDSRARFTALGVRVIEGEARFQDAQTVVAGDVEVKARRFVIATGSTPAVPPIPGLDRTPYLTNETIFEARERPKHLIVIGAGAVGLELAQAFRRLGSEVTVLEAAQPLAKEDPECTAVVLDQLAREGVAIRCGVKVARVKRVRTKVEVVLEAGGREETLEGSDLLIATGRRPSLDGLGLDAAGIKHDVSGIAVDQRLRTSNKNCLRDR